MSTNDEWKSSRRVTLEDVARRAQVSRALVSIVIRDAPGASSTTRARVLAAARELGYRPDARARALAGQKSRLIGVMFGVGVGSFHFDLLEGLYAAAEERRMNLILTPLTPGRDEQRAALSLDDFRFDALVMLGPPTPKPLLAGRVPVVVVGWHVDHEAVDIVRTSDTEGMALAVAHLVQLGHRRIAHIDGGDSLIAASRRNAYVDAMRALDLHTEVRIVAGGQSQLDGQRAARTLLLEGDLPSAIIAYNDDTAVATMGHLAQHGIDIPGSISVVGWDDNQTAALSEVPLTSVAQQPMLMAKLAIERALARISGRRVDSRELILEPQLVLRSSTAEIFAPMS